MYYEISDNNTFQLKCGTQTTNFYLKSMISSRGECLKSMMFTRVNCKCLVIERADFFSLDYSKALLERVERPYYTVGTFEYLSETEC